MIVDGKFVTQGAARRVLRALAAALLAGWAGVALAAESYVVVSLIGDRITIATAGPVTGTHLDGNRYEIMRLDRPGLDDWIAGVAEGAIGRARPGAQVTLLRVSDPSLRGIGAGGDELRAPDLATLVSGIAKHVPAAATGRVVLIAPLRAEPELLSYEGYKGHGNVAGLGFYLGDMPIDRSWVSGFLGVFANFQLALFDPAAARIEARERVVVGSAHSASLSPDGAIWNTLSAERKLVVLQEHVRTEIERRIPALLSARNP